MNDERETSGRFSKFYNDIRLYPEKFFLYYRISIKSFDELLKKVRDDISKRHTPWRNPRGNINHYTQVNQFYKLDTYIIIFIYYKY